MIKYMKIKKGTVSGVARIKQNPSMRPSVCKLCNGRVNRSHLTGILHLYCYFCRYLRMIYGPSISVKRGA
jgi:hypothetical protein